MKKLYSFAVLLISAATAFAQSTLQFDYALGFLNSDTLAYETEVLDMATAPDGNIVVCGYTSGLVDFDPGSGANVLTETKNNHEPFFAKYTPSGQLLWVKKLNSPGLSEAVHLAVAPNGQIWLACSYTQTIDADPGSSIALHDATHAVNVLLAGYDANGNYQQGLHIGSSQNGISVLKLQALTTDAQNNCLFSVTSVHDFVLVQNGLQTTYTANADENYDFLLGKLSSSGTLLFMHKFSAPGYQVLKGITTDAQSNIYMTGSYSAAFDIDPGIILSTLPNAGGYDVFFAKLNSSGTLQWSRYIGGTDEEQPSGISCLPNGNFTINGHFDGALDFDPDPVNTANRTTYGNTDAFYAKYDNNGNFRQVRRIGGTDFDHMYQAIEDSTGSVWVGGSFYGTVDFDPGAGTLNKISAGSSDAYLAQYDSSGNPLWVNQYGTGSPESINAMAVTGGSVVANLTLNGQTMDADAGPGFANVLPNNGQVKPLFTAVQKTNGNYQWHFVLNNTSGTPQYDVISATTTDAAGSLYVCGYTDGTVNFNPSGTAANYTTPAGTRSLFFAKYTPIGLLAFVKFIEGSPNQTPTSLLKGIAVDADGNILITGYTLGTVDIDPSGATQNFTSTSEQAFFAKYNSTGNLVFAQAITGTGSSLGQSITTDAQNNIIVGGSFEAAANFNPSGTAYNLSSAGQSDAYLAKYSPAGAMLWAFKVGSSSDETIYHLALAPNGNIYTSGTYYSNPLDLNPAAATNNISNVGFYNTFVAGYTANGSYVGGFGLGFDEPLLSPVITVNPATGNVYAAIGFHDTLRLTNLSGGTYILPQNPSDICVLQFDSALHYSTHNTLGGSEYNTSNTVTDLLFDTHQRLWLLGRYRSTTFQAGGVTLTSAYPSSFLLVRLNPQLQVLHAHHFSTADVNVAYVAPSASGSIWLGGGFYHNINPHTTPGNPPILSGINAADMFIAHYTDPDFTSITEPGLSSLWQAYPNPAHRQLTIAMPAAATAQTLLLMQPSGSTVARYQLPPAATQATIELPLLPAGLYFLQNTGNTALLPLKIIVY